MKLLKDIALLMVDAVNCVGHNFAGHCFISSLSFHGLRKMFRKSL